MQLGTRLRLVGLGLGIGVLLVGCGYQSGATWSSPSMFDGIPVTLPKLRASRGGLLPIVSWRWRAPTAANSRPAPKGAVP